MARVRSMVRSHLPTSEIAPYHLGDRTSSPRAAGEPRLLARNGAGRNRRGVRRERRPRAPHQFGLPCRRGARLRRRRRRAARERVARPDCRPGGSWRSPSCNRYACPPLLLRATYHLMHGARWWPTRPLTACCDSLLLVARGRRRALRTTARSPAAPCALCALRCARLPLAVRAVRLEHEPPPQLCPVGCDAEPCRLPLTSTCCPRRGSDDVV